MKHLPEPHQSIAPGWGILVALGAIVVLMAVVMLAVSLAT